MKRFTTFRLLSFVPLYFFLLAANAGQISVHILDATIKNSKIEGATVVLQRDGAKSALGTTSVDGVAVLQPTFADTEAALLIVRKPGYSDLVVRCPCDGFIYALSPTITHLDGMRVVLSWGGQPLDLDLHVVSEQAHVYFGDQHSENLKLDVDSTDGNGPETITLVKRQFGRSYVFMVHDYSGQSQSITSKLNISGAAVFVYVGHSLVRTYLMPKTYGNLWTIFRVNAVGEFEDINHVESVSVSGLEIHGLGIRFVEAIGSGGVVTLPGSNRGATTLNPTPAEISRATSFNSEGEQAYRSGNFEAAKSNFRNAIELYPTFGQAFSNLSLVYQKSGNTAEAIWANRKAITLANGPLASAVRARSYYNIGRMYEAAGQFGDALRHYDLAKTYSRSESADLVYRKAIERVGGR